MANVFNLVKEALHDNEPNDQIEATLSRMFNNQAEYFLAEYEKNVEFMLALIDKAIDSRNANVNENELRLRSKLMNKFMIRDCFQYYLYLLTQIIQLCQKRNLSLGKIDTIIEILQRENVLTPFVRSHWFSAINRSSGLRDEQVVQQRYEAINMCIKFLTKMEMEDTHDAL